MAITFVGSDYAEVFSTSITSLNLPAHQEDDFGIIVFMSNADNRVPYITTATGWSELINEASAATRFAVFYKVLTSSSETDPDIQWDEGSTGGQAALLVFRGVDPSQPFDVTYTSATDSETGTTHNPQNPAITTITNSAAIVLFTGTEDSLAAVSVTQPTDYTLSEINLSGPSSTDTPMGTAYLLDADSAGTKTPGTWAIEMGGSTTNTWTCYTFALRPSATTYSGTGAASGVATISGSVTGTFAAGTTLSGIASLSGSALNVQFTTGTFSGVATVAGSVTATLLGTGSVDGVASLAGNGVRVLYTTGTVSGTATVAGLATTPDFTLKIEGPWHLPPTELLIGGVVATITGTASPGTALTYSAEGNLYWDQPTNQYNFIDSDDITFTISGTGGVAYITANFT